MQLLIEKTAAEAKNEFRQLLNKMKDNKIRNQAHPTNRRGPVANQHMSAVQQACSEVVYRSQDKRQSVLCEDNHFLWQSEKFKGKSIKEKKALVTEHSLCCNCLLKGHRVLYYHSKLTCRRCNRKHYTLLHEKKESTSKATSSHGSSSERTEPEEKPLICAANKASELMFRSITKVVQVNVWVENPEHFTHTYAFMMKAQMRTYAQQVLQEDWEYR